MRTSIAFLTLILLLSAGLCEGARIKDIVDIQGERGNSLMGTGLIVGLNDTGDSSVPSAQLLASLLRRNADVTFSATDLVSGSIALVIVTAELGPWDRKGTRIDVSISTLNDAESLQGGTLLSTELKGLDGEVYAVARAASISTASWTIQGKSGSKAAKNHPTAGRIPGGAYVEREELSSFVEIIGGRRYITFTLRNSDFMTARRIGEAIDEFYPGSSFVEDAATIHVGLPDEIGQGQEVTFLSEIMQADVQVDMPAIVVINERTGTIVVGGNVGISETAIAEGSLVVKVNEQQVVSQPNTPFTSGATTVLTQSTALEIEEEAGALIPIQSVVTVTELAKARNAIGASPRDLIAIFNALKVAGALQARIEMM